MVFERQPFRKDPESGSRSRGFTMVEVVIMMTIIVSISAIVLFSFTGLHEGAAINRAARELALAIRRAQNMSFAVTQIDTQAGPQIPPAVGVRVVAGSPLYFIFADMVPDGRYGDSVQNNTVDAKVSNAEAVFEGGITVGSLVSSDEFAQPHPVPVAHVIFLAPEAAVVLSDGAGNSLGDTLEIGLVSASGQSKKTVTVRTSGQVSIK